MADIEKYEKKKRNLQIASVLYLIIWFIFIIREDSIDKSSIFMTMVTVYFFVEYRVASTKLKIFKELEEKTKK
jgi:hypothetical protein